MKLNLKKLAAFGFILYAGAIFSQNNNANPNAQGASWTNNGNAASSTSVLGTTNSTSLIFITENKERAILDVQGNLIIKDRPIGGGGGEIIIGPGNLHRPIATNPVAAFMLKVGGSGHFEGQVDARKLFIEDYIFSKGIIKGPRIDVDTIKMDSTRGIFGHTKIFGDVDIKQNLTVNGDATFKNKLVAEKGLTFDGINGLRHSLLPNGTSVFKLGGPNSTDPVNPCNFPSQDPWFFFGGRIQLYDDASNTALTMGSDNFQSSIDASGNNGLVVNFYCGKNTYLNTNNGLPNRGGTVFMGEKVNMARNVGIGWNDATGNVSTEVGLNIFANDVNQTAIKINSWNTTVKAINVVNNDGTENFTVLQNGTLSNKGTITSNSLAGIGIRSVSVDASGKLIEGAPIPTAPSWNVGGNTINAANASAEYIGTGNMADLYIKTNATPRIVVKDAGNVGINSTSPYKMLTVNGDVSLANYNTTSGGNITDGFNGLEILGMNQVPSRRGISVDADPNGNMNFYIHSFQTPSGFNFKNGNGNKTLVSINSIGAIKVNVSSTNDGYFVLKSQTQDVFSVLGNGKTQVGASNPLTIGNSAMFEVNGIGSSLLFYGNTTGDIQSTSSIRPHFANGTDFTIYEGTSGSGIAKYQISNDKHLFNVDPNKTVNALEVFNTLDNKTTFRVKTNGATEINTIPTGAALTVNGGGATNSFIVYGGGNTEIRIQNPVANPNALDIKDVNGNSHFRVKANGLVYAREVQIQTGVFPDYVFSNDYKLMTIEEVDQFIKKNNHLPGFESADYYVTNGINTSEVLVKQQEKIEELTLYIIELQKRLKALEEKK